MDEDEDSGIGSVAVQLPDVPSLIAGEVLYIYVHIFTQNGCAALCILGEEGGAVIRKYCHVDFSLRNSSYWQRV